MPKLETGPQKSVEKGQRCNCQLCEAGFSERGIGWMVMGALVRTG